MDSRNSKGTELRLIARITSSVQASFIIICVSWDTKPRISLKNGMLPMFKKPQNLKGLTVNLVQAFLNKVSAFTLFCFSVERILMDSSYILCNKFQDYRLRFILTNHYLVTA